MSNSTSSPNLLRHYNSTSPEPRLSTKFLDDAIERRISCFTCAQLLQVFIVSFAWVFDAFQIFVVVFTDRMPPWRCTNTNSSSICLSSSSPCGLPRFSWAWDLPQHSSVISEWSLECSSASTQGLPASAFFAGCLAGGFTLSTLADFRFGRKNMLLFSCLSISLSGLLTATSPNLWVYAAFRFIAGVGRATMTSSSQILATEMVGWRWRWEVGSVGYFLFTFGFLSLPLIAYINRASSWRYLYLLTSIPSFCYTILIYFFVYESPRWLFQHGRREEALQTLNRIGSVIEEEFIEFNFDEVNLMGETHKMSFFSILSMMWERKWALRRLMYLTLAGFGCGVAYYGMPSAAGTLGLNLYLTITFNALAEFPASLLTLFVAHKWRRKTSVLALAAVSTACSISCAVLKPGGLRSAVEAVAFFAAVTAFNVLLMYCLELFPTCVRNSALMIVRQAMVVGSGVAPLMAMAARKEGFWSYGVFGLVLGLCELFVIWLPETKGRSICDTMEEEEFNYKEIT